ncbi:hypothetical protein RSAG8_04680, partial [Rhizoctonia solani AG-8 WAC10335]
MASEHEPVPLQTLSRRGEHSTRTGTIAVSRTISQDRDDHGQTEFHTEPHHEGLSLPPVDRGFAAWSFVAAAFALETLVWGFGFTYGVFQEYFLHHRTFGDASEAAIGAVGTVALAIEYFEVLIVILVAQQWPHRTRLLMWSSLALCCGSLVLASFATKVSHLIVLQVVCLYDWDDIHPGARLLPSFPVHGRIYRLIGIDVLKWNSGAFGIQPVKHRQIIFGHVCDIAPYQYVVIVSGAGAALSAYLLWGFAHNLGMIFGFVIIFGSLSGGLGSVWPAASVDIAGSEQSAVSNVFGLLAMSKGIAAVIGPLIAAELYHPEQSTIRSTYSGYGFRDVTLFVGSMMVATAAGGVATKLAKRVI